MASRPLRAAMLAVVVVVALSAAPRRASADGGAGQTAVPSPAGEQAAGRAATWRPLRVHLICQRWGQSATCGVFLPAVLEAHAVLEAAPRANADVTVYVSALSSGNLDRIHLRFVPADGAVAVHEVEGELDTRAPLDRQREVIEALFVRGALPFLERVAPQAVAVTLTTPRDEASRAPTSKSPWGLSAWMGGWGSWSGDYSNFDTWSGFGVSRVTGTSMVSLSVSGAYRVATQPPLLIDGKEISLDTSSGSVEGRLLLERHLNAHWSTGALLRGGGQDDLGRYAFTGRAHVGLGHDWYLADDPRGNSLSIAYLMGVQHDEYQMVNVLGETASSFPSHGLLLRGSVRSDDLTWELRGRLFGEVDEPTRRFEIEIAPSVQLTVGDHVDLSLSLNLTKQAVPGPVIDPESFAEVTRSSYAEPLTMGGSFNLRIHWDRTDTARNDRFSTVSRLGNLSSL